MQSRQERRAETDFLAEAESELDRALVDWRCRDRWSDRWLDPARRWSEAVWRRAVELGPLPLVASDIAAGRKVAKSPLYVCGAARSGTTLIRDLLDGHPALAVLPSEGKFFEGFQSSSSATEPSALKQNGERWLRLLANPNHQRPFWLLGEGHSENSRYVTFARALIAWNAALSEHSVPFRLQPMVALSMATESEKDIAALKLSVDKSPGYEFHLKSIWSSQPQAKVIQVVRDPAAIAASYSEGLTRNQLQSTPVSRILRNVTSSFVAGWRAAHLAPRGRFLLIQYEDLVADRARELRRVSSFLEIDWDDSLSRQTIAGHPAEPNSSFHGSDRRPFNPANARERFWLTAARCAHALLARETLGHQSY